MPSNTFFRLEKEKQDKILEASKKEFSKFPLEEASIANIVKEAGIPRGSFYQYFTGKEDVFFYLFEEARRNLEDSFISYLEKTNGDLFETFKLFFYDYLDIETKRSLFKLYIHQADDAILKLQQTKPDAAKCSGSDRMSTLFYGIGYCEYIRGFYRQKLEELTDTES